MQEAYRAIAPRFKNLDLNIFSGVLHGYMMPAGREAFDQKTRDFSMARAKAILEGLPTDGQPFVKRHKGFGKLQCSAVATRGTSAPGWRMTLPASRCAAPAACAGSLPERRAAR